MDRLGQYTGLESGGGALAGVAITNFAQGKLGILNKVVDYLPMGHIAINTVGGIAIMNLIGEAPLDVKTVVVAGGVAVLYNVAVGMLSADLQNKLNGTN